MTQNGVWIGEKPTIFFYLSKKVSTAVAGGYLAYWLTWSQVAQMPPPPLTKTLVKDLKKPIKAPNTTWRLWNPKGSRTK